MMTIDDLQADFERWEAQLSWWDKASLKLRQYYNEYLTDWTPWMICRRLKWFWQRGRRGYSDRDTWEFDSYLARVIAGGVRLLREDKMGHPCSVELCGVEPGSDACLNDCSFERNMKRWQGILDEMAEGFEARRLADDHPGKWPEVQPKLDRSLALFKQWFTALWD